MRSNRTVYLWILVLTAAVAIATMTVIAASFGLHTRRESAILQSTDSPSSIVDLTGVIGSPMLPIHSHIARGQFVTAIAFSPDGPLLATASFESDPHNTPVEETLGTGKVIPHVQLWDVNTGQLVREISGAKDIVRSVRFSSDGQTLACGYSVGDDRSLQGEILLSNVKTGELRQRITKNIRCAPHLTFTPSGVLATAAGHIQFWETSSGENLSTIELSGQKGVSQIAFWSDGQRVAGACSDGIVRVWDVKNGKLLAELRSHRHAAFFVGIALDGTLITAGWGWSRGQSECDIIWWDVEAGKPKHFVAAHTRIEGMAISPDGKLAATSGGMLSGELMIWRVADARLLWSMKPGQGERVRVSDIAFSPDSKMLAITPESDGVELLSLDSIER